VSALLALVLLAPGCPEALARAQALPPQELAGRAQEIVAQLEDAGTGPTGALARAVRALEPAAEDPSAPDAAAASFRVALARHCALAAARRGPDASPRDREALAEVLARPELARGQTDLWALRRALDRLWDWIVDLLGTAEAERYASLGRALFVGAAAGAGVLLLSALRRRADRARRSGRTGAAEPRTAPRGPDASAARAEEALRRSDGRAAVRFALLAALEALERAGRVPRGRALTNDEVVAAASPAPGARSPFAADLAALARAFDRAVYGGAPVAPDDAHAAVERSRRVALALARPLSLPSPPEGKAAGGPG
jgi:hypothetical protein